MIQAQIKKIFSHALIYGVGNIVNRFLGFLLLPIYTHYYNPEQFGIFSLVYAFWFIAAVFYLFGMETAFQKFFVEAKDSDKQKKIFGSTWILIFCSSVALSLLIYFISPAISYILTGNSHHSHLIQLLAILLLIDALSRFPMIILNAQERSKIYTLINVSTVIVNIFFNVLFIIVYQWGIEAIFYAFIISYSYQLVISFIFCYKFFVFEFDKEQVKELTRFGITFLFYGLFLISLDLIDRFFLRFYQGEDIVGIYSACYRIGVAMNLVISGFRTAWIPFFLKLKDDENNKEIFSRIFTYFTYGGMILFLIISLFASDIVRIQIGDFSFLGQKYWAGMSIVPYILLAYFFFGLYTNLNIASYYENKIKYLIYSTLAGCVSNIIFNIILIPRISLIGAALATLLSYYIMFIVLYYFSQKVYYIQYEWNKIVPVILSAVTLVLVNIYSTEIFGIKNKPEYTYFLKVLSIFVLFIVLLKVKSIPPITTEDSE